MRGPLSSPYARTKIGNPAAASRILQNRYLRTGADVGNISQRTVGALRAPPVSANGLLAQYHLNLIILPFLCRDASRFVKTETRKSLLRFSNRISELYRMRFLPYSSPLLFVNWCVYFWQRILTTDENWLNGFNWFFVRIFWLWLSQNLVTTSITLLCFVSYKICTFVRALNYSWRGNSRATTFPIDSS